MSHPPVYRDSPRDFIRWITVPKAVPYLLMLIGLLGIAAAVSIDLVGLGEPGFGLKQMALALAGLAVLSGGIALTSRAGQRYLAQWAWRDLIRFLGIAVQLALFYLVIRQFRIENEAFYIKIMPLALAGFVVHHFLPHRYRLPFFVLLSLFGIWLVFGSDGFWLMAVGVVLIGICLLPIPFWIRLALLVVAGLCLAMLRVGLVTAPWSATIWPILASIFMFRMIVYLYDLRHSRQKVDIPSSLAYFFLLPNVVFPLFPVIDYTTFRHTYYDEDAVSIYQRGVHWMLLGFVHLMLYRFVYQYLVISPTEVATLTDLGRYMVTGYLLYLRVSGQFHLIAGVLHLFGFHLPPTNDSYFLASGFTDFWRRINIYWKDFMLKVFYKPAYFRVRKRGTTAGLVFATAVVVVATWSLHSYQWFWILGRARMSWPDVLFWAILGLCLIANSLYESKRGRKRSLGKGIQLLRANAWLSLQTLGFFAFICVLWSLWNSPTLADWFALWAGIRVRVEDILVLVGALLGGVAVFFVAHRIKAGRAGISSSSPGPAMSVRSVSLTCVALLIVYLIGNPLLPPNLGVRGNEMIRDLSMGGLNTRDAALLHQGYYESLTRVNRLDSQLWEIYAAKEQDENALMGSEITRLTGDFLRVELRPLAAMTYAGEPIRVNRWGMRDQDYEMTPPPNTYRIALLGPSDVMGQGVADDQTFEWLLEERLNQENAAGGRYARYEILNFAVFSYGPPQMLWVFQNKVPDFDPDALFYVAHTLDEENLCNRTVLAVQDGAEIPFDYIAQILREAGINREMAWHEAMQRLRPYGDEINRWALGQIIEECRRRDILPVCILLPQDPGTEESPSEFAKAAEACEEAGFVLLDLSNVWEGFDPEVLRTSEWDWHANAKGHQLIADRLYRALLEHSEAIPLGLPTTTGSP